MKNSDVYRVSQIHRVSNAGVYRVRQICSVIHAPTELGTCVCDKLCVTELRKFVSIYRVRQIYSVINSCMYRDRIRQILLFTELGKFVV